MRILTLSLLVTALSFGPLTADELRPSDVNALPESPPTVVEKYGEHEQQFGELRMPGGTGPFPVAVIIHGGCWTQGFATLRNTSPISSALTDKGFATWNIEYRQVGDPGGGWPGTFLDWGAAVDHLRVLSQRFPLDLSRVVVAGHSAGAHGALWVAGRSRLPAESEIRGAQPLPVEAAVAIDGVGDLASFAGPDLNVCGKPVIAPLMGGTPSQRPERYAQGSPLELLPLGARQFLVASRVMTSEMADAYVAAAKRHGERVQVLVLDTGHFEVIAPGREPWSRVEDFILSIGMHEEE